jgi:ABC-type phosphate/phosphonate transport system substrate-binding protein
MLNELLGTRFKIVSGYQGNSTMTVAMERGEVEGVTNSWDSWKSFNPAWVQERKIKVLVQTEPRSKELAGVPSVQELARSENDRKVIALIVSGDALGKPLAASPNVPSERVQALRDAFEATIKDPAFIEAAAAARIEIDPIHGLALQATVEKVLATPKNLAERARMIIAE